MSNYVDEEYHLVGTTDDGEYVFIRRKTNGLVDVQIDGDFGVSIISDCKLTMYLTIGKGITGRITGDYRIDPIDFNWRKQPKGES